MNNGIVFTFWTHQMKFKAKMDNYFYRKLIRPYASIRLPTVMNVTGAPDDIPVDPRRSMAYTDHTVGGE